MNPAHPAVALPPVIGHRGYSARAPENTLSAVIETRRAGVRWVELDAQLLGDATPVIWHDRDVGRCSNGRRRLIDLTREDAARLDAGRWFGNAFAGEPMATLDEMLALLDELDMGLNLELKVNRGHDPAVLAHRAVPEAMRRLPPERLIVSSFSARALAAARNIAPPRRLALGTLYKRLPVDWRRRCEAIDAFSVHLDWRYATRAQLVAIRRAGYAAVCYTVNEPAAFARYRAWGAASVISDDPAAFLPAG
ncbi:glycerophosphodiester phosphodiesterase family protein [Halomonas cibimaris]|uniref:Glycerophosphodiester phosphodiesterase family protein n=1 Tax=Halomonas cibimaris TaxID=657012 RepID=A0ABP7L4M3_9GAMM